MRLAAAAVLTAGCNQLYGLDGTRPAPPPDAPVIRCFSDDFEDGVIDPERWTEIGAGAMPMPSEADGQLQFVIPMGVAQAYNGLVSVPFDLTGGTLSLQMTPAIIIGFTEIYAVLDGGGLSELSARVGVNQMVIDAVINNNKVATKMVPYSADLGHVRFRHDATTSSFHIETSPDGAMWTEQIAAMSPYRPLGAQLTLIVGGYQMPPMDSIARYDNVRHEAPGCVP